MALTPSALASHLHTCIASGTPITVQVGRFGAVAEATVVPETIIQQDGFLELAGSTTILRIAPRGTSHGWLLTRETPQGPMQSIEVLDEVGCLTVGIGPATLGAMASPAGWTRYSVRAAHS